MTELNKLIYVGAKLVCEKIGIPSKTTDKKIKTQMMWKILTAQIREEIYSSLTSRGLFPEEQKGCCKVSRGTGELLYIDQHILYESNSTGNADKKNLRKQTKMIKQGKTLKHVETKKKR